MLEQMMGGKKMDEADAQMAEQMQKEADQLIKAAESGDIGKVMEAMGNITPGMTLICRRLFNRASTSSSGM